MNIKNTNKNQKRQKNFHYISDFYLRRFGFKISQNSATKQVYTLNRKEILREKYILEKRNSKTLCNIKYYNTPDQEDLFGKIEDICSKSIDTIIDQNFNSTDINNIKFLIAFFYSNTPDKRQMFCHILETLLDNPLRLTKEEIEEINSLIGGPFQGGFKRKGHVTISLTLQIFYQLITWKYKIIHIVPQKQKFITSDKPVCSLFISTEEGFSVNQGWENFDADGNLNSPLKKLNELELPEKLVFYFPINPETCIFLYHKINKIENFTQHLKYLNFAEFINSDKYLISKTEEPLKELYKEINNINYISPSSYYFEK